MKFIYIPLILFLLPGCASMFVIKKMTVLEKTNTDTELIVKRSGLIERPPVVIDTVVYPLANKEAYLVTQQLEGYRTSVTPIYPTRFNWSRIVDGALVIIGTQFFYNKTESKTIGENGGAIFIVAGFTGLVHAPKRLYPSKIVLPPLTRLPFFENVTSNLSIKTIEMPADSLDSKLYTYDSFLKFEKNNASQQNEFSQDKGYYSSLNPQLLEQINEQLNDFGLQQASNSNKSLFLSAIVEAVSVNKIDLRTEDFVRQDVRITWVVSNSSNERVFTKTVNAQSNWFTISEYFTDAPVFYDGLEAGLLGLLQNQEFITILNK